MKRSIDEYGSNEGGGEGETDVFDSPLAVPQRVKDEIDGKSLAFRWINAVELQKHYGYRKGNWVPYKSEAPTGDLKFGVDPEGYIRRGDCILAVRPKEEQELHRKKLQAKANRAAGIQKAQAQQLKQRAADAGVAVKIHEGYDEN